MSPTAVLCLDDLRRIVQSMPKPVAKLLKEEASHFLAGGAIRSIIASEPMQDWDIFGPNREKVELTARRLFNDHLAEGTKARFHKTKNAFTVLAPPRTPVQFISRWCYADAETLLQSFDFSIARAVVWFEDGQWFGICDAAFYPDLAAKRLRYMQPERNEDAGGSMLRAQKFMHRGYHISPEQLAKVMARLTVRMRQDSTLLDTEDGHARVLVSLLREVDPLMVIDGLEVPIDEPEAI